MKLIYIYITCSKAKSCTHHYDFTISSFTQLHSKKQYFSQLLFSWIIKLSLKRKKSRKATPSSWSSSVVYSSTILFILNLQTRVQMPQRTLIFTHWTHFSLPQMHLDVKLQNQQQNHSIQHRIKAPSSNPIAPTF